MPACPWSDPPLSMDPSAWDPHNQADIADLNGSNARLHAPLWVTTAPGNQYAPKLDLPTLHDRRKQQCLSFFHKVVGGLGPGMPVEQFLKPVPANKKQIN